MSTGIDTDTDTDVTDTDTGIIDTDSDVTDTDVTDTDVTGTDDTDTDTDPYCPDCLTSSELANDPGGAPCDEGCSSAGLGGAAWWPALLAAWLLLRQRTR